MTIDHTAPSREAAAILADPAFTPPPAADGPPGGLAWLRHRVARFASGEDHRRRRALALEPLAALYIEHLRQSSRDRTTAILARAAGPVDVMSIIARHVPVQTLAAALGAPRAEVADVRTIAAAYPTGEGPDADAAVASLIEAFGGRADEVTAAKIGLLVQTCDATAGLIGNALAAASGEAAGALIATTLESDPPVRATTRQAAEPGGAADPIRVDLKDAALPFGSGPHACPGRTQAVALATGVCEALQDKPILTQTITREPSANLSIPARLEVLPR